MLLKAPTFLDKTGRFPYRNLDYVFRQLHESLDVNRQMLGEDRYRQLSMLSARMRTLFEADPEDKTGKTSEGRKIILEMEEILKEVRRNDSIVKP
jgi:hypothetical protein